MRFTSAEKWTRVSPCLGTLGIPLQRWLMLLPRAMNACQHLHSVRVPLPRRLLQKRHAPLSPGFTRK